jgi:serine/threonine protein kinase
MGKRFPIRKFPCRIGRPAGDLALSFDSAVSREHAEVDYVNGGFTIQDLGSANGTFVNGRRLQPNRPEPLLFGTRILLGSNTQLTFISNELTELPDMTGELIGGRYKLSEKLLASAKSVVYRASDNKLPQSALVKILSPRLVQYPGYREQFEREAKVACRLRHPSISRILDYGETELPGDTLVRTLYIAVEYLEGGSLAHRLAAHERFEVPQIAGWLDRLASALSYVHDQSVIHGSIKPSAIVFDSYDNPYLTDFALAVSATDNSHRTVIGSPPFLAPEQWDGEELSPATDQYSLGVLFYLILTGSHPHEGQEHPEVRRRNLLRGPIPAHEMAAQNQLAAVPVEASKVLQRAMSAKPGDRFPNILAFARALGGALTHKSEQGSKRPFVFISYHRETGAAWALLFRNELDREYGCEVFVDTEQRDTAGQFPQKLERNIERCDVFVCLLAENTLGSMWVNREIELAHKAQKPMVPVFQESFCFPKDTNALPPHVKDLLLFDGVKLLDRQNVFVSATISSLSKAIRHSLPDQAGAAG